MSQSQSLGSDRQDREWKSRVSVLEHELKETKDYYLKRIEALEKGHTPAPGTVLSDSTLIVAAESLASADQKIGSDTHISYCLTKEHHLQREVISSQQSKNEAMQSQADRQNLYEKLGLAEQVLE